MSPSPSSPAAVPSSDTLDLLERLVAIDTTSSESNLPLLEVVTELLDDVGVEHHGIPDATGEKANLIATVGPRVEGGVVLAAHTDCVPVTGQPWSTDPFTLVRRDDRVVGRGTTDMKGFLACVLAALPRMVEADLQRPIVLGLTHDEEVGALGAEALATELVRTVPAPAACLVGEPTSMRVVDAHKGVRSFTVTVTGRDGHSSKPHLAANAIAALARIATHVDDLAARHRDVGADPRFDPPHTTFNLATIAGGQAINIVPRHAELTFEYRPVPADDSEAILEAVQAFTEAEVLPRLRRDVPDATVTFERGAVVPALRPQPGGAAETLVRSLTGDTQPSGTVPFGTDGGHIQAAGIPTVVFGPGDIDQAHQPDEFILLSELARCEAFLDDLVEHLRR
ncbi:MAG: acetylornithine deacetylase [Actinomycetes bacterium]